MRTDETNPPIETPLRLLMLVVALILISGAALFFLPNQAGPRWPWALTPFNTCFLGAVYSAELISAGMLAAFGRWAPACLGLLQAVVFTATVTVVSFLHLDRFDFDR